MDFTIRGSQSGSDLQRQRWSAASLGRALGQVRVLGVVGSADRGEELIEVDAAPAQPGTGHLDRLDQRCRIHGPRVGAQLDEVRELARCDRS